MEITKGVKKKAQKICIYGPEGIGKSTIMSKLPNPLFIDTEGSTSNLDVARLPNPLSWEMIKEEIKYVKSNPSLCKTLVIDTIDWAEHLCVEYICEKHSKKGIEDFGYGNGYVYVCEELGRFLNSLSELIDSGINVALAAHTQVRKFELPDEMGSYDRYELKLGKKTSSQTSPLVKEWVDLLLFANYKTQVIATDKDGKKHKAQGGVRVMYTTHHPCWDAKNRHNLPDEIPFEYESIAHIFNNSEITPVPVVIRPETPVIQSTRVENNMSTQTELKPIEPEKENIQQDAMPQEKGDPLEYLTKQGVPRNLAELMHANNISVEMIERVVADKGYFPFGTPITNYPADFINKVLVAAWEQVKSCITQLDTLPF